MPSGEVPVSQLGTRTQLLLQRGPLDILFSSNDFHYLIAFIKWIRVLMFLLSSSIKALLIVATSSSLKASATNDALSQNLGFPLNHTKLVQSANETTTPANTIYGDDNIAWPDTTASTFLTLPPLNLSLTSPELGAPSIRCDGKAYGKNLKLQSCLDALAKLPRTTAAMSFGERGHGDWGGVLPYRVLSSNGLCAIDISHKAGVWSDMISPWDLRQSVELLINVCVRGNPSEGGVVSGIGKDGNLAVRVMPYKPTVRCGAPISSGRIIDCKVMVDNMPAHGTKQTFGQKDDTDAQITVRLPTSFSRRKRHCQILIDTLVPGEGKDTYDWYKMWAAATAVEFMCIHKFQEGTALQLGDGKKLMLQIKELAAPSDTPTDVSK